MNKQLFQTVYESTEGMDFDGVVHLLQQESTATHEELQAQLVEVVRHTYESCIAKGIEDPKVIDLEYHRYFYAAAVAMKG